MTEIAISTCIIKSRSYYRFLCFRRLYQRIRHRTMATLETLQFQNLALRRLPIDQEERNYVRTVNGACFSRVSPTPVANPKTIAYSADAMALLDLPDTELKREDFAEYFSGNRLLPGSEPAAHCYCGHQFGFFSGQLGDGAAMYLGEVINKKGERWELQLKGAGPTPYSRTADGRKVMRSSIREFLCSEAMHHLGIPTSRAGSCVTSDTEVVRDVFYNGRTIKEKCTVISRIAPTFLRFGSFEIFNTLDPVTRRLGPSVGRHDILKDLLDYTIEIFYPEIHSEHKENMEEKYLSFFNHVVLRTAQLVAEWQCVGFCHGVLNTDNMSIIGLTIDYGPFGFMDIYNPDHICNASDSGGRYSYKKQPEICLWNLRKLANAIQNAVPMSRMLCSLDQFLTEYKRFYLRKMRCKLGLLEVEDSDDSTLIEKLLHTMEQTGADFTNTFRCLSILDLPGTENHSSSLSLLKQTLLQQCYPAPAHAKSLAGNIDTRHVEILLALKEAQYHDAIDPELEEILSKIERAKKMEEMSTDEKERIDAQMWSDWLQVYVCRLEKEAQSCTDLKQLQERRVRIMNRSNPRFVLRNHIAQKAIEKAESGDFSEVQHVLCRLEKPFDDDYESEALSLDQPSTSKTVDESSQYSSPRESGLQQCKAVEELPPLGSLQLRVT